MSYEIDAACKRGVAAYLAEQHSFFRNKTLGKATLTGAISSALLFGADTVLNLDLDAWQLAIPFLTVVVVGLGVGAFKADNYDAENIDAFNSVCRKKHS
jgi:hypothetical protein